MQKEIKKIIMYRVFLEGANYTYYNGLPYQISDSQYDWLKERLIKLEKKHPHFNLENSPSMKIGGYVYDDFEKVKHSRKILSLQKIYDEDIPNFKYLCERIVIQPKVDGMAIIARYDKGKLSRVLTRGDGIVGNDITSNAKTIVNLPMVLKKKETIEVRGEVFIPKSIDNEHENLRAKVSGLMKLKDSKKCASVVKKCVFYDIHCDDLSEKDKLAKLNDLGLPSFDAFNCIDDLGFAIRSWIELSLINPDVDAFLSFVRDIMSSKHEFEIDGVVIRLNNYELQKKLGSTSHHPKWMWAYKPKNLSCTCTILKIEYSISDKGKRTPIAHFEPTDLGDFEISKVNLHNESYIKTYDLKEGDKILVELAGGIIPKFIRKIS